MALANFSESLVFKTLSAKIDTFKIDSKLQIGNVNGGSVTISPKEISLILYRANPCLPGRACLRMMPAPFIKRLPLVSTVTDRCGVTHYVAKRDSRMVDGALEEIRVVSYAHVGCRI